jgi:D-3-phosphoglycerate dehydrogenase / 2-oxoglutarate reductase
VRELRALVVEDDLSLGMAFATALKHSGFVVEHIMDSTTVLAKIEESQPDLVTLDVQMPTVSGIDILRAIRANPLLNHIKVMVVTANSTITQDEDANSLADVVLLKPVSLSQITTFATRFAEQSRSTATQSATIQVACPFTKIIIPDDYQQAVQSLNCFHKLNDYDVTVYHDTTKNIDTLVERFYQADALVLIRERTAITEPLLARLPNLKFISQTGKGAAHIDLEACTRHRVAVAVGTGSPYAPAELTWALILAAMRNLPQEIASMKAGYWQTTLGRGLHGRTLGIFGYGKIGSLVAGYGRAFGMNVLIWGREGSLTRADSDGFETVSSQRELFERSDILSLHIKLSQETRGLVTADDLAVMQPSALLVNTSRAELIAPGALVEALQAGRPGYAAVDVYEAEPVSDHPLLHMDNVMCTPHIGYVEKDSYELYFDAAFDQLLGFAAGNPTNILNSEVLAHITRKS